MQNERIVRESVEKKSPRVYLYGLDEFAHCVHYYFIPEGETSVRPLMATAATLKAEYPSVVQVFAADNHPSLYRCYLDAIKKPSLDNDVEFKLMLEKYGIEIPV